jgi:hypothetical protein
MRTHLICTPRSLVDKILIMVVSATLSKSMLCEHEIAVVTLFPDDHNRSIIETEGGNKSL